MSVQGKIWGVGVGPGDADLITLKGLKILQQVDVVAYPAPTEGPSLARQIIEKHLTGDQDEVAIRISMNPNAFPPEDVYDQAAQDIEALVGEGKSVAILCEGDPFFYGSFMYLFERLAKVCDVEVVPGVTSLTACAAALHLPLASRNETVVIVPATLPAVEIAARLRDVDMMVVIKVGRHLEKVREVLVEANLLDHAHYIERATMAAEVKKPLAALENYDAPYFSMILVHRHRRAI